MRQFKSTLHAPLATIALTLAVPACVNDSGAPSGADSGFTFPDGGLDDVAAPDSAAPSDAGPIDAAGPFDAAEAGAIDATLPDAQPDSGAPADAALIDAADAAALAIYVNAASGNDATGDGTAARPYQTIAKAGGLAISGQTLYLAAGSYTMPTLGVHLADGVGVAATTYGTATLAPASGNSYGLVFSGSGFVHGLAMISSFVGVSAGTVTLDGVQFANIADSGSASSSGINVTGTGHAIVTPGGLTNYLGAAVSSFASVIGAGQLEIHGGALNNAGANVFDGSALIAVSGTGHLLLDGVTIDGAKTSPIGATGTSQVTLENGTVLSASAGHGGSAWTVNINNGSPVLVFDKSTITASPATGIYVNGGASPSLTFRNGAVIEKSVQAGITFQGGGGTGVSTLVFDTARISGNGGSGVQMGTGLGGTYSVTMRSTQITGNTANGIGGVLSAGSVVDLGSASSAGANTFTGNGASSATSSNVSFNTSLSTADLDMTAVGNTWDPTANGADGSGHFPAATTFSAPPTVSGKNVQLSQGGTSTFFVKLVATP